MPPTPNAPNVRTRGLAAALAVAVALLAPLACGGGEAGTGGGAGGEASADEAGAEGGGSAAGAATAAPAEGEDHTHGPGTHSHPAADTLAGGVALDPGPDAGWAGSTTLLAVGDSVRVLVSVQDAAPGSRYGAELLEGSCGDPGPTLADLPPVAAGSSGAGSSQATVPAAELGGRSHGALRLTAPDGPTSACADVHLAADHEHEGG